MKKVFIGVICILVILLPGCSRNNENNIRKEQKYLEYGYAKNDISSNKMLEAAENEKLILRYNPDTTDVEVYVKETGYTWNSSSGHGDSLGNILQITYIDNDGKYSEMSTFTDSIKKGQYEINEIENGIAVNYSFGEISNDLIYPIYITAENFEMLLDKMSPKLAAIVTPMYFHLAKGLYNDEQFAKFKEQYPYYDGEDCYVLRSSDLLLNVKKQISAAFAEAGYTIDDYEQDCKDFNIEKGVMSVNNIQFNICIEYQIDDDNLKVRCPKEKIYWSSAVSGIQRLTLLPEFGSPDRDEKGYYLFPDGSGSIMNFYNGTDTAGQTLSIPIYGENLCITKTEEMFDLPQAIFPVFGEKNGDNAFFAVIEKGDAVANVNLISGTDTLMGRIWADFCMMDTQEVYAKALSTSNAYQTASYTMAQAECYSGDIAVRYHFLTNGNADYSGMARYYSDYLFKDKSPEIKEYPLYLNIINAVDYAEVAMGLQHNIVSTLTTFEGTERISEKLLKSGISRQKIILNGWQEKGLRESYTENAKISKKAGGEKGLENLRNKLESREFDLFLDTDVQFVYQSALSGRINKSKVSRTLVQQLAKRYMFDLSDYQTDKSVAYIMNPLYTADSILDITNRLNEKNISGVCLSNVGKYNIADYKDTSVINRQEAADIISQTVKKAAGKINKVVAKTGNIYAAKEMTDIIDMPIYSRRYNNTEEIPFAAMVYSGHIEYTSKPFNLNGNTKKTFLKHIENGAALLYTVCLSRDDNIKYSDFNEYYSIVFQDVEKDIVSTYAEISESLEDVYGESIVSHNYIADHVVKVLYGNSVYFIINYNEYPVDVNGTIIAENDFIKGVE